jgi:hypothetical protein
MPIEEYFEEWDVDALKEGEIIRAGGIQKLEDGALPVRVKHMRVLVKRLSDMYYSGKAPSPKEFKDIFRQGEKYMQTELQDTLDQLESEDDFFKVDKKIEDKDGNVTIKLKKLDKQGRIKVIRSIVDKVIKKLTPDQIKSLLEEGIRKNNDVKELEEMDKALDKEDVKIEAKKGCFKLVVGDKDIMVIR